MERTEKLLKRISELYLTNPKEADKLYQEEYLPLVKKENSKIKKELKKVF